MKPRWILLGISCFIQTSVLAVKINQPLIFCGGVSNDLYKVLKENGFTVKKYNLPADAITSSPIGSAVFIVADGYPEKKNEVNSKLLRLAKKKNLRLYIEYPASLPGLDMSDTIFTSRLDRAIITSDVFGKDLKPMSILGINDCHILQVKVDSPLIVLGKVAGFDKAVYGIKDVKTYPVLFRRGNEMIAMTKLSNFATGRYGPTGSWKEVWEYILSWMTGKKNIRLHTWLTYVSPIYSKSGKIPVDATRCCVINGINWYFNAHLFIDSSWKALWLKYQGNGTNPVGPPVSHNLPNGNGSLGVLEGPTSQINYNGTQQYRYWVRADDQGETAYALSAAASFLNHPSYDKIAGNLMDFVFHGSNLRSGNKEDKNSPVFGLIGWAVTHPGVFYGDDNARCMLGMIGASAYMHTDKWDKDILENLLANFRTTGKEGFRGDRLDSSEILSHGWQYYWNRNIINPHPHFESWLWACYLWLYSKTGYTPLLGKTETAIKITMEDYPDKWKWTNGLQQERARMILPLAWLVRVSDTKEHREWLNKVVTDLLSYQVPSGVIREELGAPGLGLFGPVKSNADYGKGEAPLIFKNGDPVADMLYTCNFAFFGLNEAAHATGNKKYVEAEKKLADFLIRIQVKSNKFQDINGAWFRAFDYKLWDYWASNADAGWGAWSTLTGWTQSWILTTEILVKRNQSFWELTKHSQIDQYMKPTLKVMFPQGSDEKILSN
jgi:hypothetical protein